MARSKGISLKSIFGVSALLASSFFIPRLFLLVEKSPAPCPQPTFNTVSQTREKIETTTHTAIDASGISRHLQIKNKKKPNHTLKRFADDK